MSDTKKSNINLANGLTASRVFLGLVFLGLFLVQRFANVSEISHLVINIVAFFIFVTAIITDGLDGYVARKTGTVTDFGKHFDPLADSIFFVIVFGTFVVIGLMPWYLFLIVLFRECYMHIYLRPHLRRHGTMLPANIYGKLKTVCQSLFSLVIIFMMILLETFKVYKLYTDNIAQFDATIHTVSFILFCIIAFLSIMSLLIYLVKNKDKI